MDEGTVYQIRVHGELDQKWSAWFDGMAVQPDVDGTTLLTGSVADQPALYGLVERVRDLGLTLLDVYCLENPVQSDKSVRW